ncbi:MAG: hypothetical protein R3B58_02445 [Phycisphaerales bacterium]|nr:hypothetical protein [Phycisphaerales bacterium]
MDAMTTSLVIIALSIIVIIAIQVHAHRKSYALLNEMVDQGWSSRVHGDHCAKQCRRSLVKQRFASTIKRHKSAIRTAGSYELYFECGEMVEEVITHQTWSYHLYIWPRTSDIPLGLFDGARVRAIPAIKFAKGLLVETDMAGKAPSLTALSDVISKHHERKAVWDWVICVHDKYECCFLIVESDVHSASLIAESVFSVLSATQSEMH